ncbi:MAG TPA: tetratricopeptide repeat protein [Blastocatellia bacterium]|nr:tetratricopeptide repeat protein [Blastocatellia bacterium]
MLKKFFASLSLLAIVSVSAFAQDWDHAVSLYNQKQYRAAIREFHAVMKANPDAWKSWYYIGASHYFLQGYEDAIDALQNFIKAAEKDETSQLSGYYFIGWSYLQLKQFDKAIPALTQYLALAEKTRQKVDPATRAALGRAYVITNHFAEAVPVLTATVAESKADANNYYMLGFAQYKLGRSDQAVAALNQALAVDAKNVDALALLGEIYFSQMRQNPAVVKQVISVGERLLPLKDDQYTWVLLGQAYLMDKQFAKAAPLLDKYARAHTDNGGAWYNLGLALSRSDQFKPAAEALEKAVKLAPTNVAALLEMGYVYESDKQYEKALSAYERAYEASGKQDATARAGIDRLKQIKPQQPPTKTSGKLQSSVRSTKS